MSNVIHVNFRPEEKPFLMPDVSAAMDRAFHAFNFELANKMLQRLYPKKNNSIISLQVAAVQAARQAYEVAASGQHGEFGFAQVGLMDAICILTPGEPQFYLAHVLVSSNSGNGG